MVIMKVKGDITMKPKEVLQVLEETGALLNGHFELRSGLHSDRYFQCANILRYPRVAGKLCGALVEKMHEAISDDLSVNGVIAPALGGIIVGYEIARALDPPSPRAPHAVSGLRRTSVCSIFVEKEGGALALRRFKINEGERFIVAEDVVTRGGRVQETVNIVEGRGGKVVAIAVLVDRSGGSAKFNYPTFSLIQIEPTTWEPDKCPLCEKGIPLVHPGS